MLYKREGGDARAGLESKIMLRAGRSADARAGCPTCDRITVRASQALHHLSYEA